MKRLLVRLALWIYGRWGGEMLPVPNAVLDLMDEAVKIVRYFEETSADGTSGEWKRHNALSKLMKMYPAARKTDIALAIELAVRSL